jgi:hypothetical protein
MDTNLKDIAWSAGFGILHFVAGLLLTYKYQGGALGMSLGIILAIVAGVLVSAVVWIGRMADKETLYTKNGRWWCNGKPVDY